MPTFDFLCTKCSNTFEFSRPFGSQDLPACPVCGSRKTKKVIAPPAVHFKGSGWYKTDSRVAPAKESVRKEKTDATATETKKEEKKTANNKQHTGGTAHQGGEGAPGKQPKHPA